MERKVRDRAEDLAARLTLEEKIGMVHGAELFATRGVERLGIPPLRMSDSTMGVRQDFEPDSWHAVGYSKDFVTYLPCCSALAATWNRELAEKAGSVLGAEARTLETVGRGESLPGGRVPVVVCEVANSGGCAGKETVQVYLRQKLRDKNMPYQELAGFEKVELAPGEKRMVQIRLHGDVQGRKIVVGSSSRDIRVVVD
ncbi:MAG: hypothetical protein HFG59_04430 [Lachnospiraceae bacterium]|nr:hypothetical protein [Lachnospiraceae bacterium]